MKHTNLIFILVFLFLSSCSHVPSGGGSLRGPAQQINPVDKKSLFVRNVDSDIKFNSLAQASNGVIRQGLSVKVLLDNRQKQSPQIYFLNANYCPVAECKTAPKEAISHFAFAKTVFKDLVVSESEYLSNAYYTQTIQARSFFDFRIETFKLNNQNAQQIYYGVRFIERDLISQEMIQFVFLNLQKVFKIPNGQLVFIKNSEKQVTSRIDSWLKENKISVISIDQVLGGADYFGMNVGTAYGFLRYPVIKPENLEPFDIPVFDQLPLDLAVVAAVLSTEYQDVGSHVNLKSKERGTPNAVIRNAENIRKLNELNNQPIKLTVYHDRYLIEPSTEAVVYSEYNKKINIPWKKVSYNPESQVAFFSEICKGKVLSECLASSKSYGGKVSGMAFLAHSEVAGVQSPLVKKLGYRLAPMGFGVPISYYHRFMEFAMSQNSELKRLHDLLIDSEMGVNGNSVLSSDQRREVIEKMKSEILNSPLPADLLKSVHEMSLKLKGLVEAAYPGVELDQLKIRSSSNTEDIKGFNGAGLHDSFSARLSKTKLDSPTICRMEESLDSDTGLLEMDVKPKSLDCSMKAAYASLWNERAVRERSFRRLDHSSAGMGLAVHVAYKFRKDLSIKSNSVLVTRVLGTDSVYGYQLSTQVNNGLVTNPIPGTKSELLVVGADSVGKNFGLTVLQYAKPTPQTPVMDRMILTEPEVLTLVDIARAVEIKYCQAMPDYYPGGACVNVGNSQRKTLALDMEFKQFSNGQFMIKQVRTFSGK